MVLRVTSFPRRSAGRRSPLVVVVALAALTTATVPAVAEVPTSPASAPASDSADDPADAVTYDDLLLEVSEVVPRFGGFFSQDDVLQVWLTGEPDDATAAAAVDQLATTLDRPDLRDRRIRPRQATYTWPQLMDYKARFVGGVDVVGQVFSDIDDRENRLTMGYRWAERDEAEIRRQAEALGIPRDALHVVTAGPVIDDDGFSDVPTGSTHAASIDWLVRQGIALGYADGTFGPADPVARQQMAAFLDRALDLPDAPDPGFTDVDAGSVHGTAVANLAAAGIVEGFPDGTFGARRSVTRGQVAAFLDRALDLPDGGDPGFDDVPAGSTHARAIAAMAAADISGGFGDGTFRPHEPITRGQMASLLQRALGG